MHEPFPTVHWSSLNCDATFFPGEQLLPESEGRLWAVLTFLYYGDRVALADIAGRGLCIPSGKIEPGESLDAAAEREAWRRRGRGLTPRGGV